MQNLKKEVQSIISLYKSQDLAKAENLCKKIIINNPKIVFLYNLLGLISVGLGKINKGIKCYEEGIKIDPNFSIIYSNLGLLYANYKNDHNQAEIYYKKSISLNKNIPEAYNNLGSTYLATNKTELAIKNFKKTITIDPNFFNAYHNLGNAYTSIGDFSKAKKYFFESVKVNPYNTNSHRTLSRLIKYSKLEKHFTDLKNIYESKKLKNIDDRVNISFSLGKAYEDIKNYNKSFFYYNEASKLYSKKVTFSITSESKKFKRIKETFDKKLYEKYPKSGSSNSSVIFILGMPRSGTTLIEQILSSHKKVYGADEQIILANIIKKKFNNNDLRLFFGGVKEFSEENFKEMGNDYIKQLKVISNNSEIATDKMTENFLNIGFIKLILPNAKIIHSYRDPKDNCLSVFKNHFPGGKIPYSYDLKLIVQYYNLYKDLMEYWNKLFNKFVYNIKYEDLISMQEKEIKNLLNFCNLDWDENCLNFHKNKRTIKTASDVQARSKIYQTSAESWRNYEKYMNPFFKSLNVSSKKYPQS